MKNIAVLVSGGGSNLQAVLDNCKNNFIKGRVCVVVSNKAGVFAEERAKQAGVPFVVVSPLDFATKEQFDQKILQVLLQHHTDIVALCGYLKVVGQCIVKNFEGKILNVHPSLIPAYCGMNFFGMKVHQAVIDAKEEYSGATVHLVDDGVDSGKILLQEKCKVDSNMTAAQLQERVLKIEHKLMPQALKNMCEEEV